jgi:hypothetical protein
MNNPVDGDRRPDLFDLWKQHHFCVEALCLLYKLRQETILAMLRHKAVFRNEAAKVLCVLSKVLHQNYNLHNVRVRTIESEMSDGK